MAWTAPMTAVTDAVFTATQFNLHVRDNLLEMAPAKATQAAQIFVAAQANSIGERNPESAIVSTSQTTTSTSYTDLTTVGPTVNVTSGTTALVFISAKISNSTAGSTCFMSYEVSGETTFSAVEDVGLQFQSAAANQFVTVGHSLLHSGLTEGTNTFTAKYKVSGNTGTFVDRRINVLPL